MLTTRRLTAVIRATLGHRAGGSRGIQSTTSRTASPASEGRGSVAQTAEWIRHSAIGALAETLARPWAGDLLRGNAAFGNLSLVLTICALILLGSAGCTRRDTPAPVYLPERPAPAGYYRIRSGDTLSQLAEHFGVKLAVLADWNDLQAPYPIQAGRLLRVVPPAGKRSPMTPVHPGRRSPGSKAPDTAVVAAEPRAASTSTTPRRVAPHPASSAPRVVWQWPLTGPVVQGFKAGDRTRQGIRIAARPGQLVAAAAAGKVVFSGGGLKGYGNLIILEHADRFLSAYGFNRRLLVAKGEAVERGQTIAEVGQGAADTSQLHFEIRKDGVAIDPMTILPQLR